jgi:hypothetical protein
MMYNSQIQRLHSFYRPPAQAVEACARLSESGASQCPCLPAAAEGTSHDVMSAYGVRRDKAALSSGCKPHPAAAPAGSNRSSHGGNEVAEAFD